MRKLLYPILVVMAIMANVNSALSQNWLYVQTTQAPWKGGEGSIDSVEVHIEPQGVYSRVDLIMSFSARGHTFEKRDTLEVIYGFTLPDYAFVQDSWLWVGDEPVQADILDTWSAFRVYESIVNRRLDPSLLTKYGQGPENNYFQLRIFPMAGDEARKVKMTFFIPAQWTDNWVSLDLPVFNWFHSYKPLQSFVIQVKETEDFGAPLPSEGRFAYEEQATDDGTYHILALSDPAKELGEVGFQVQFDSPLQEGVYLRTYPTNSSEGVYQLVFLPEWAIADTLSKNVLILVDLHSPTTQVDEEDMGRYLRTLVRRHIKEADSFNILFSQFLTNGGTRSLSDTWISGDLASIDRILEPGLLEEHIGNISNLPILLAEAKGFMEANTRPDAMVLISSSDQYGSPEVANEIVDKLQISSAWPPIHIVDFATQYPIEAYQGINFYFQGNEYLYTQLVRLTSGEYFRVWNPTELGENLDEAFLRTYPILEAFDMHTSLTDGFCFDRFNLEAHSPRTRSPHSPITQVGKYFGSFPFELEVYGSINDSLFFEDYVLDPSGHSSDSSMVRMWTANQIMDLEQGSYDNRTIAKVVDLSLENRILSTYTAFLALEPWMSLDSLLQNVEEGEQRCVNCDDCFDCFDGPVVPETVTSVEAELEAEEFISVYPNPFVSEIQIQLVLPAPVSLGKEMTWTIFDAVGKKVLKKSLIVQNREISLEWDGKSEDGVELPGGVYFVKITYGEGMWVKRIVKQ